MGGTGLSGRGWADGREIAKPSRVAGGERLTPAPAPTAAEAALYLAMTEAEIADVKLARRLGCHGTKEVQQMPDPRHPTELPPIKEALNALGKRLLGSLEQAA